MTRLKVAIIGGGIGGLTLALSLLDAGIDDVDVYESAAAVKELGVGCDGIQNQPQMVAPGPVDRLCLATGFKAE